MGPDTTTSGTTQQRVTYNLPNEPSDSIEWLFYVSNSAPSNGPWFPLPGLFDYGDYFSVIRVGSIPYLAFEVNRIPKLSEDSLKTDAIRFYQAKVLLIPTGIITNLRTNINWNDYNDVKEKLHLRDEDEILVK